MDSSHLYQGELIGDRDSTVFGSIIDGVFEGKVTAGGGRESYYVERAKHYFRNSSDPETHPLHHVPGHDRPFHSVIYREEHVDDPYRHRRKGEAYLI